MYSKDLSNHERIKTLEGESAQVTLLSGATFIDPARVKAGNAASNGVVHIINELLMSRAPPPSPT